MDFAPRVNKRALVAGALGLAAIAVVLATPNLLSSRVGDALRELAAAGPEWLWLGGCCFAVLIASTGCAWRAGVRACGGDTATGDAAARYAVGSLANALLPAGPGGPIRIALYSRLLPERERLWIAAGISGAIAIARAPALALLFVAAAILAGVPLWPVAVLAGVVAVAAAVAIGTRCWTPHARLGHVLDVFRALGRQPRIALEMVGWIALATAGRVGAAACVAAALGVPSPLATAVVIVPALALSGLLPLTPGNVGIGSGVVAVALSSQGLGFSTALSIGIAVQAVEAGTSILAGSAALLYLAQPPAWSLRLAGTGACLALGFAFGATVLV